MDYTFVTKVDSGYDATVDAVRAALAEQGFGVLTEIDVRATMKAKLDIDVPAQIILGACRPPLAHRAMTANPSVAALLPCNVVVRAADDGGTVVEAIDPNAMMSVVEASDELTAVAEEATTRIRAALDRVAGSGA